MGKLLSIDLHDETAEYLPPLPDPARPLPNRGCNAHGRAAQRRRRASALAATRASIAAGGLGEVTIARVADRSELSKQTIYNLIGNRADLIKASLNEYIAELSVLAEDTANHANPLLALADLYWRATALFPDYIRNAALACSGPSRDLYENAREHQARMFRRIWQSKRASPPTSQLSTLCFQASILTSVATIDWASGALTGADLRQRLADCQSLILLAASPTPSW